MVESCDGVSAEDLAAAVEAAGDGATVVDSLTADLTLRPFVSAKAAGPWVQSGWTRRVHDQGSNPRIKSPGQPPYTAT